MNQTNIYTHINCNEPEKKIEALASTTVLQGGQSNQLANLGILITTEIIFI